jgi:hypothetical protein
MPDKLRSRNLPPAEPGSFGGAVLSSYTLGYLLGMMLFASQLLAADVQRTDGGYFAAALGIQSTGWAELVAVALCLVMTSPVNAAAREYYRFTRRTFIEDRIGFAKAGGQDIGTLCGLIVIILIVIIFGTAVPPMVPGWIRIPLILALSNLLGRAAAAALSRRVFDVLFGPPIQASER